MPKINWNPSVHGGWYCVDKHGNYWHMSANREVITVTSPAGLTGSGWTAERAWSALSEAL